MAAVEVLDYYKSITILEGSVNIPRGEVTKVGLLGRNIRGFTGDHSDIAHS